MRLKSIQAKLNASAFGFLTIVVLLAMIATVGLRRVDQSAAAISQKWVVGSQMLGELSDRISEFRVAEGHRALARTAESAAEAEHLATEHAEAISNLVGQYQSLVGPDFAREELNAFRGAWARYAAEHDAWVRADAALDQDEPAQQASALQELYKAADEAGDELIERNQRAASLEAAAADQSTNRTTLFVMMSAIGAGLLTAVIIGTVERRVTGPLKTITMALSSLAAGQRDVQVPELSRTDEVGTMAKALEVFRANAVALVQAQELADTLARHDALTGLPNRRLFAAELEGALEETSHDGSSCAVMLLDLDRFKPVNDLQGHAVGDSVLCEAAARLTELVGASGTVARLGGDEFVVLMHAQADAKVRAETAIRLAGRIVTSLNEPISVGTTTVQIGASLGIALCPEDGADAETILRAADLAMYRAKQEGRGSFRFFEQIMDEEIRERANLEADLRRALEHGDIRPFYQPLIAIAGERICGFEVLARWEHPDRGFVAPDVFVPLIEQLGLMGQFTTLILKQACRDARDWDPSIGLAVNVSPAQFQDPALPALVLAILNAEGFAPTRLEIEVTESALVGDLEKAKATLEALQQVGIKVALDDFGTGYSSLYHLRELKFDKLKIDRSFVQSMQMNQESQKIVDAVLGLAISLNMPAVAEGIENRDTMLLLSDRGCTFGQGYHFSRAVNSAQAGALLSRADVIAA